MIHFYCLECGMKFQVKDEFAGRSTKCPTCKSPLQVPELCKTEATLTVGNIAEALSSAPADGSGMAGSIASVTIAYQPSDNATPVNDLLADSAPAHGRYLIDKEIARDWGLAKVLAQKEPGEPLIVANATVAPVILPNCRLCAACR